MHGVIMAPEHELPAAPAWFGGSRLQWQTARIRINTSAVRLRRASETNSQLHARSPAPVYYHLGSTRMQIAGTGCKCWHCGGKSPEAIEYAAALAAERETNTWLDETYPRASAT